MQSTWQYATRLRHTKRTYNRFKTETLGRNSRPFSSPAAKSVDIKGQQWLHDIRSRIGRCINFGLQPAQVHDAGQILQELATGWRALLVGTDGFLTTPARGGLLGHRVVWGDADSMGHVNNVVYNKWAEAGRVEWALNFARTFDVSHAREWRGLWTSRGDGMILKSIKTDFKFPITFPDRVSVFHKLAAPVGGADASFMLDVLVLSERHQRIAARCFEDVVLYDYRTASKVPLGSRPFVLKAFEDLSQAQEQEAVACLERRSVTTEAVRRLETNSWDRPDAKEDQGSAAV